MSKILLAGSTGYLGKFILTALLENNFDVITIVRNEKKLPESVIENKHLKIIKVELTQSETIKNCCSDIDVVISTVGITKQKDGLSYMDVDFKANLNLLEDAKKNGVKKLIYVSVLHGEQLTHIKICEAKEKFVEALKRSGLDYCIIRPTGYFSDMGEFYKMAEKGKVFLFGNGENKINPIHGADLAEICLNSIQNNAKEICIGGPQVFTFNQLAETAFAVSGKKKRIMHIPAWLGKSILFLMRVFTSSKTYGPLEFLMTVLTMDVTAPVYGKHYIKDYFEELKNNSAIPDEKMIT
ncbi:MAG: SDR family oxidoreductase [Bacteroidetes bacterium]|nr:SDR family oxidoreductase [Bacteroidota bacterium]